MKRSQVLESALELLVLLIFIEREIEKFRSKIQKWAEKCKHQHPCPQKIINPSLGNKWPLSQYLYIAIWSLSGAYHLLTFQNPTPGKTKYNGKMWCHGQRGVEINYVMLCYDVTATTPLSVKNGLILSTSILQSGHSQEHITFKLFKILRASIL